MHQAPTPTLANRTAAIGNGGQRPVMAISDIPIFLRMQKSAGAVQLASLAVVRRSHTRRHGTALVCAWAVGDKLSILVGVDWVLSFVASFDRKCSNQLVGGSSCSGRVLLPNWPVGTQRTLLGFSIGPALRGETIFCPTFWVLRFADLVGGRRQPPRRHTHNRWSFKTSLRAKVASEGRKSRSALFHRWRSSRTLDIKHWVAVRRELWVCNISSHCRFSWKMTEHVSAISLVNSKSVTLGVTSNVWDKY